MPPDDRPQPSREEVSQLSAGSLLDSAMIVYGSGISDGDRHNHDDLPILMAGKGGGTIKPGRHLQGRTAAAQQSLSRHARPHGCLV